MQKTCWYTTILPLRVGALIGASGPVDLERLVRLGFTMGAAFQIRDDVLNLAGSSGGYGKEALGDLREGKRTLMLIHLLAAAGPADRRGRRAIPADAPVRPHGRGDGRGARADARPRQHRVRRPVGRGITGSAAEAFAEAFADVPDSPARRFVEQMIDYVVDRDR